MARYWFGADIWSFLFTAQDSTPQYGSGSKVARLAPSVVVTFWSALTGGTQYTDLLNSGGGAVTSITSDANGLLPAFQGPNDIRRMAADAGAGRKWIITNEGIAGPAGGAGGQGPAGAQGKGPPQYIWDGASSWYEVVDPVAGTTRTADRSNYASAAPVSWLGAQTPTIGTGTQHARDNVDIWDRTP